RAVITDPKYNLGVDYGRGKKADLLPPKEYLAWCEQWMNEAAGVLAPDGSFWIVINDEWAADFIMILRKIGLHQRGWIKIFESFGQNNSAMSNFSRTSRHALYFAKHPSRFIWNPVTRQSWREKNGDRRACADGKVFDDVWGIPG